MYGCERGFYTIDCSKPCESTCVTGVCGRQEGFCPACDEVPKGWLCYDGGKSFSLTYRTVYVVQAT